LHKINPKISNLIDSELKSLKIIAIYFTYDIR
jgi:hypothetical protein